MNWWSRELRALWELLGFSILRRERCGLEALGCCCKDVFRLLRRTPTRSDVLLCFVLCLLLELDPSQATLAVRGTGPEHLP